jgi:hypothetical protein
MTSPHRRAAPATQQSLDGFFGSKGLLKRKLEDVAATDAATSQFDDPASPAKEAGASINKRRRMEGGGAGSPPPGGQEAPLCPGHQQPAQCRITKKNGPNFGTRLSPEFMN